MRTEDDAAPEASRVDVRLVDLTRRFGDLTAVDAISLDIARGEFFTLLGASGSGKTTTLRLIAGFELPDGGRVEFAGTDVTGRPAHARDVNTVFQDHALFPHVTVRENVETACVRQPDLHRRRGAVGAAAGDRDHPRLPLHPARGHRDLRVQLNARAEMAAGGADLLVVREGLPQPRRAPRAGHQRQGRAAGHDGGARARDAGVDHRRALSLLRPRGGLVPRHPAHHPARDRDRHGAQLDLHAGARRPARPADDRRRPRDVLHRRGLQQRRGPAASQSFEEASADLGANGLQTFRHVVFPQLRSALVAGGRLAFALSFDEIIATTFTAGTEQTLPIWIYANLSRPRQLPIVNVVAVLAIPLSLIPVCIAQRITADPVTAGAARAEAGAR